VYHVLDSKLRHTAGVEFGDEVVSGRGSDLILTCRRICAASWCLPTLGFGVGALVMSSAGESVMLQPLVNSWWLGP
jgi:hypothetical protein